MSLRLITTVHALLYFFILLICYPFWRTLCLLPTILEVFREFNTLNPGRNLSKDDRTKLISAHWYSWPNDQIIFNKQYVKI